MSEIEPLPEGLVDDLCRGALERAAAGGSVAVEHRQTHISHLFLTPDRVYKLRKAVELPFLSFSTRARRNADCLREIELNRRLAPDVYLGVAPICPTDGGHALGPVSESIRSDPTSEPYEHCVVMRRLPEGGDALSLLEAGLLEPDRLDAVADRIAAFHQTVSLGRPAPFTPEAWLERVAAPVRATLTLLRDAESPCIGGALVDRCERALEARLRDGRAAFEARRAGGRVVDGHGDLHLDHVWFETGRAEPLCIDCIEFDDDLRHVDVAAELAFLVMDLAYRDRQDLGERVLRRYAASTDDFGLYEVVDYHVAHRALVRASVAAVATREEEIDRTQREAARRSAARHLGLAVDWLERERRPALVLVAGVVGSGKSTVAEALADEVEGAVIASDRVRKHLAGLPPDAHTHERAGGGLYADEKLDDVYRALLERARPVLRSGRVAILDATWSRRAWRHLARRLAATERVPVHLVEARCGEAETLARLERRQLEPGRISDAGPDFYAESVRRFEPLDDWDSALRSTVATDAPGWRGIMPGLGRTIHQGGEDHE